MRDQTPSLHKGPARSMQPQQEQALLSQAASCQLTMMSHAMWLLNTVRRMLEEVMAVVCEGSKLSNCWSCQLYALLLA
jgi:hypothetical protein